MYRNLSLLKGSEELRLVILEKNNDGNWVHVPEGEIN